MKLMSQLKVKLVAKHVVEAATRCEARAGELNIPARQKLETRHLIQL